MRPIGFSWPEGKVGAATSSWDDGQVHDRRLVSILNERGLKGTWNLNASILGESVDHLSAHEINALFNGHEVACHTYNHPHLELQPEQQIHHEVFENRRHLEELVGYPIRGFAYPYGTYDRRLVNILRHSGLLYCRTINHSDTYGLPSDFLEWNPTCHCGSDLLKSWTGFINSARPDKLFFLWGHSWEFEKYGTWDTFGTFAELCGNAQNIWHATNIEIFKYVDAWRTLWCSASVSSVFNPSATPLWFRVGRILYQAKPGETRKLDQ